MLTPTLGTALPGGLQPPPGWLCSEASLGEASFGVAGSPQPPWVQSPLTRVLGAVLMVQPAPEATSVPASLRQSLGISYLR